MKKCLAVIGLVLLVVNGCADDKEQNKEAVKQAVPDKQEKWGQSKQDPNESKLEPARPKTKLELTQEKLAFVNELIDKLQLKKEKLQNSMSEFEGKIAAYVEKIKGERNKKSLKEYDQAVKNLAIAEWLAVIQKAEGYKAISEENIANTSAAIIKATGTKEQLELNKIMLAGLDETAIDALIVKLDIVIDEIEPQAGAFVIKLDDAKLPPLNELYEKYIRAEEREKEKINMEQQRNEKQKRALAEKENVETKENEFARLIHFAPESKMTLTLDNEWPIKLRWHSQKYLLAAKYWQHNAVVIWDVLNDKRFEIKSSIPYGATAIDMAWNEWNENELAILFHSYSPALFEIQLYDITTGANRIITGPKAFGFELNFTCEINQFYKQYIFICCPQSDSCALFDTQTEKVILTKGDNMGLLLFNSKISNLSLIRAPVEGEHMIIADVPTNNEQRRFYTCPPTDRKHGDGWIDNRKKLCQPSAILHVANFNVSSQYFAVANNEEKIFVFSLDKPYPIFITERFHAIGRIISNGQILSMQKTFGDIEIDFFLLKHARFSCRDLVSSDSDSEIDYANTARTSKKFPYTVAYMKYGNTIKFNHIAENGNCERGDNGRVIKPASPFRKFEWSTDGQYFAVAQTKNIQIWKMY